MHIYPGDQGLAIALVPRRSERMRTDCSVTHARDRPRQYYGSFCRVCREEPDGWQARFCHSLGTRGAWRGTEFVPGRWAHGRGMLSGGSVSRELGTLATKGVIDYNCWSWFRFLLFGFFGFFGFCFFVCFCFCFAGEPWWRQANWGWPAEGDDQKHCWLSTSDIFIGILISSRTYILAERWKERTVCSFG